MEKTIDYGKFVYKDPNDPLLMGKTQKETDMLTDYAAGLFYNTPQFYAGISATQISQAEFTAATQGGALSLKRHYYIIGGYNYDFSPSLQIQPSTLIKTDFVSTQYDINARVLYNNMMWGGLTYRSQDAIVVMTGVSLLDGNLDAGIAYDITTSSLGAGSRSKGSFEIFARYCFKIVIPHYPQGHRTVRFL
jgi:type IX secretion system PorP/SprF family membrane protein